MRETKKNNVFALTGNDNFVVFYCSNEIHILNGYDDETIFYENVFRIYGKNSILFFQNEEGHPIKIYKNDEITTFLDRECYLAKVRENQLIVSEKSVNNYIDYICMPNLTLKQIPFFPNYANTNFIIDHWDKKTIKMSFLMKEKNWQKDISSCGKYINLRDEEQPNEIDGGLMGFENLLFVPLRGGQLLALDVETGEEVWMLEQEISGQYAVFQDKIYKKNEFLYEINALTGEIIRQKNIGDGDIQDGFIAIGPIWIYEDIIILINNYTGDIVLLNKNDFSVFDKIKIDASIAHSKDTIIWHDNKLYVLDLNNTLHIFEDEK